LKIVLLSILIFVCGVISVWALDVTKRNLIVLGDSAGIYSAPIIPPKDYITFGSDNLTFGTDKLTF
jgi:hypothetical protein